MTSATPTTPALPNLAIIGAQKSATSFVQGCLAAHPRVHLVHPEIPLFEEPGFHPERLAELACHAPRRPVSWWGIKRPDYLASREAPVRLAAHLPDVKLIAVLRDPVERALSAYYHYMRYCYLPARPAAEGVAEILAGGGARGSFATRAVLDYGRYATHLRRWWEHFPRERLLVLLHQDVQADPAAAYARLLNFLELDTATLPPLGRRPNEGVYSPVRIGWLRAVQRVACRVESERNRWGYRAGWLGMGLYFLARQVDKKILRPLCARRPEPLPPDLLTRLRAYYAAEVEDLEGLLGVTLPGWKGRADG